MMPLSLSYDHRVVDGAAAARFLNDVIDYLQSPGKLLLWANIHAMIANEDFVTIEDMNASLPANLARRAQLSNTARPTSNSGPSSTARRAILEATSTRTRRVAR